MRMVGYIRVSTDHQRDNGVSLDAQRDKIERAIAADDNMELVGIIEDTASAKDTNRPGLSAVLNMLMNSEADGVIIYKLDRLTRSLKDLQYLIEQYFSKFVLISCSEKIDTTTETGKMILNIMTTIAQWERGIISERTREAAAYKKSKGERWGKPRYGYRVSEDGRHLEEHPEEQAVINFVARLHTEGKTIDEIQAELASMGKKNRVGNPIARTQVWSILRHLKRL